MGDRTLLVIADVCRRAAAGDWTARLPELGDAPGVPECREAVNAMLTSSADRFAAADAARIALADELEHAVLRVSEQVATAATEMGASSKGLADFARAAVTEAESGLETVTSLRTAA